MSKRTKENSAERSSSKRSYQESSPLDGKSIETCENLGQNSEENKNVSFGSETRSEQHFCEFKDVKVKISGKDIATPIEPMSTFSGANLNPQLQTFCSRFASPTPIQAFSFHFVSAKRDLIGVAQTGSGKTIAFSLPIFNRMMKKSTSSHLKFLILCPTRELCGQIHSVFEEIQQFTKLSSICIYGGVSRSDQLKGLRRSPQIVVATPGRLNDFLDSGEIDLSHISYVVLDEADRMLDLGFEPEVRKILSCVPSKRQTLMFSATWPYRVQKLSTEFMANPISIVIGNEELSANSQISQFVEVLPDSSGKISKLRDILLEPKNKNHKIIVFVLYKAEASKVESYLLKCGLNVVSIHGDKQQNARNEAFERFRKGQSNILVATDVAARGLDIPNVELVINYTFPLTIEDYVHRIGRTGRGTKTGVSRTFFTPDDKLHSGELVNILKKANQDVPQELLKFGTTVKKKEHKEYGAFYKEIDPSQKGMHVKFDD